MSETTTSEKPVISAETIKRILAFRDDRNWKQFHNPKDLAISISLEAAELLEPSLSKYFLIANQEGTEKINGHPIPARKEKSNPRENPFQGDYG